MAGVILQCFLLVNYALVLSRGYRYHAYYEEDGHEITQEFHEPRPISRIDHDETIRHQRTSEGAHQRSIPFTSDVQRVQEQERRRLKSQGETARAENGSYKIVNHPKPSVTSRRGPGIATKTQDNVLFPGPTQGPSQTQRTSLAPIDVPEKCKLEGICEDVPNYPQELVDRLLSRIDNATIRFNVDELEPVEFTQRIGGPEEIELCNFKEQLVAPRLAEDGVGKWHYVVNKKEKPVQAFRVEICQSAQQPCSEHAQFTYGYKAYCKQKYTLRKLAVIGVNHDIVDMPFPIPTCCSCVLKPSFEQGAED